MEKVHGVLLMTMLKMFIIFSVDNSSTSHTNNRKNDILVLREGPPQSINDSTGASEKKISTTFSKTDTKFCLSLHDNDDDITCI